MSNTNFNKNVIDAPTYPAPTVVDYTPTTTCTGTVVGHAETFNVDSSYFSTDVVAIRFPMPVFNVQGACKTPQLTGFTISTLPTRGQITLNGTAITNSQVIAPSDFTKLEYTITNSSKATDTFVLVVKTTAGNATGVTYTLLIDAYELQANTGTTTTSHA